MISKLLLFSLPGLFILQGCMPRESIDAQRTIIEKIEIMNKNQEILIASAAELEKKVEKLSFEITLAEKIDEIKTFNKEKTKEFVIDYNNQLNSKFIEIDKKKTALIQECREQSGLLLTLSRANLELIISEVSIDDSVKSYYRELIKTNTTK